MLPNDSPTQCINHWWPQIHNAQSGWVSYLIYITSVVTHTHTWICLVYVCELGYFIMVTVEYNFYKYVLTTCIIEQMVGLEIEGEKELDKSHQ